MLPRLVLVSALGASCLLGCGGSEGYGPGNSYIDRDCDPSLPICDVLEERCQERVWTGTACQRSQRRGNLPTIRTITSEEFGEELQRDIPPGQPPSAWDITLGLLGLVNAGSNSGDDTVAALVEGVLGFYDSRTGVVTLLSDATGLSRESKVLVLSHEFVHVLQDRSSSFELLGSARSSDELVANDALTEGEATVHSNIALAAGDGAEAEDLNWESYFGSLFDGLFDTLDESRSPYVDTLLQLPYPLGGAPVLDAWLADGQRGILHLYTDERMHSVADWMRDYPQGIDSPRPQLDCPVPAAPADYEAAGRDVLGVVGITALWAAHGGEAREGWRAGRDWRGGTTSVFAKGDDPDARPEGALLVWQMRWANEERARDVVDLLEGTDLWVRAEGQQVVIAATDDDSLSSWIDDHGDDWFACDNTKQKQLSRPLPRAPRPWPEDVHWTLRSQLPD